MSKVGETLKAGDRLVSGIINVTGDGAVDITSISVDIVDILEFKTNLATGSLSNVPLGSIVGIPFTASSAIRLLDSDRLVLKIVCNAANLTISQLLIVRDRPKP